MIKFLTFFFLVLLSTASAHAKTDFLELDYGIENVPSYLNGYWGPLSSLCDTSQNLLYFDKNGLFELRRNKEKLFKTLPKQNYSIKQDSGLISIDDKPYFKFIFENEITDKNGTSYKKCEEFYDINDMKK